MAARDVHLVFIAESPTFYSRLRMGPIHVLPMKSALCCFALFVLLSCASGISKQDIAKVQASIRKDFEKKGFTVTDIKLEKQSAETLAGVVRLRKTVPSVGDMEFSKVCSATVNLDTKDYTWKCQ